MHTSRLLFCKKSSPVIGFLLHSRIPNSIFFTTCRYVQKSTKESKPISKRERVKIEYQTLRQKQQFPEDPAVFEKKLKQKIKKLKETEDEGVTVTDDPLKKEKREKTPKLTSESIPLEEQEALLKTLLRKNSEEERVIAASLTGPVKKLLNPELFQLFKESYIDYNVSATAINQAEKFFHCNPRLSKTIFNIQQFHEHKSLHQVSFAGRSNVGKSSLINKLLGEGKKLARVSKTPGMTQSINYYVLGDTEEESRSIYLVDMPGYGFGKAPKPVVKQWQTLMLNFFEYPSRLQHRCFLLIDSRIGIGKTDEEMIQKMEAFKVNYQIVLTKVDELSTEELRQALLTTQQYIRRAKSNLGHPWVIPTSSRTGLGINELKACICLATGIIDTIHDAQ